jgi:hypothetical protein
MKRISWTGPALATVAAGLIVLAPTSPASFGAAKAKPDCPKRALCLWDDENYLGDRVVVKGNGLSNKVYAEMNDLTSSVYLNRKDRIAVLYQDINGGGDSICLTDENRWRNYKIGAPFDDAISSSKVKRNVPPSCTL